MVCKSYRFCSGLCNARCIPTYGYRRVHAILKRQALAANHKRVYRVMKVHGLLLDRHAGGVERRHDGRIAADERNRRANRRTVTGPPAKPAASPTLERPQKTAAGEVTRG